MPPEAFHLSSEDKAQVVPRLSVWAGSLTSIAQADLITGQKQGLAGFLLVDGIRRLRPDPEHDAFACLDVEWEPAEEMVAGAWQRCTKPGADGHCGITRLNQDRATDGTSLKVHRKSLYASLARMANTRRVERIVRTGASGSGLEGG